MMSNPSVITTEYQLFGSVWIHGPFREQDHNWPAYETHVVAVFSRPVAIPKSIDDIFDLFCQPIWVRQASRSLISPDRGEDLEFIVSGGPSSQELEDFAKHVLESLKANELPLALQFLP